MKMRSLLLGVFAALAACGGDDDAGGDGGPGGGGSLFLRFDANGSRVEFTEPSPLLAAFSQSGNQFNGVFTASGADSDIVLQVFDDAAIAQGTYAGYDVVVGGVVVGVLFVYHDASQSIFSSGGPGTDATLTISELTDTRVGGTFQGTLSDGEAEVLVTNGEFLVQRAP